MKLLADDDEWMGCLRDAFASKFEPLTTVLATFFALCEPSSPDWRNRYEAVPEASSILRLDEKVQKYAMWKVRDSLKNINDRLIVGEFGLTMPDSDLGTPSQLNYDHGNTK